MNNDDDTPEPCEWCGYPHCRCDSIYEMWKDER